MSERKNHGDRCPYCGEGLLQREEVDIGVGVQMGPARCPECGWDEADEWMRIDEDLEAER